MQVPPAELEPKGGGTKMVCRVCRVCLGSGTLRKAQFIVTYKFVGFAKKNLRQVVQSLAKKIGRCTA